jgi:hypothetical protein
VVAAFCLGLMAVALIGAVLYHVRYTAPDDVATPPE